ncbi:uncharacterized protein LOC143916774 [Arctopsyche grandis]|uniref:uncharacterized protein LOC143916774 n=1 Tax=Arctopsyche grandis TaxID=121162 RepID=UPI00406D9784
MKLVWFALIFGIIYCVEVSAECHYDVCNYKCMEQHFQNGKCIDDDMCACYQPEENILTKAMTPDQRGCNNSECSDWCWKIGKPGGLCSFGICRCYGWDKNALKSSNRQ